MDDLSRFCCQNFGVPGLWETWVRKPVGLRPLRAEQAAANAPLSHLQGEVFGAERHALFGATCPRIKSRLCWGMLPKAAAFAKPVV